MKKRNTDFDNWWYGNSPEEDYSEMDDDEEYWDSEDRWDMWAMLEEDLNND